MSFSLYSSSSAGKQQQGLVKVLTYLTGKLSNTNLSPSYPPSDQTTLSQKSKKSSYECKNAMRTVHRTISDPDFAYDLRKDIMQCIHDGTIHCFQSQELTTRRLLKGVRDSYNGTDKCPFSVAEIKSAAKIFHKSLKDA